MQNDFRSQKFGNQSRKNQKIRHIVDMNYVITLFQVQARYSQRCQKGKPAPIQNSRRERLPKSPVHWHAINFYFIIYFIMLFMLLTKTDDIYLRSTIYRCFRNTTDQRIKRIPIKSDSSYMYS